MKNVHNAPIACSLTSAELRDREAKLLAQFRSGIVTVDELGEGYAFQLPGDRKWITLAAELIAAERECCPFLTFEMVAGPGPEAIVLRVFGPAGAKELVKNMLWNPTAST